MRLDNVHSTFPKVFSFKSLPGPFVHVFSNLMMAINTREEDLPHLHRYPTSGKKKILHLHSRCRSLSKQHLYT